MANIAFISPLNPSKADSGSKIRIFNLINELHRTGHRIHLIILNASDLSISAELKALTVSISLSGHFDTPPSLLKRLKNPVPEYTEYVQQIKQVISSHSIDAILACKTFTLAQLDLHFIKKRGIPVLADEACVHHLAYLRQAESSKNPMRKMAQRIRCERLKRQEIRLLKQTDLATAVSQEELSLLNQMHPAARVLLIPNGINPDDFPIGSSFAVRKPELFFCGDYSYQPNADAISYYTSAILPKLKKLLVSCPLNLAGKNSSKTAPDSWITPLGYVDDIHSCFLRYQIMINPMRQGAGTRLKMLESLAAGMACVSTTIGAEGLGLTNGEHLIIADTPEEFAQAIYTLIIHPEQAENMAERGRAFIFKYLTWSHAIAPLLTHLANPDPTTQQGSFLRPPISVLICTKGHHLDVIKTVDSIKNCGYPSELVHIAVLEETDTPEPIDGTDYHTLPLLHKGFGYARNQSIKLAKHELVVFADDDCLAEPGWLESLIRPLVEQPELLATAGLVRLPPCGPIGECESILGFPGGGVKLLHQSGGQPMTTSTFSTCNCAVRLHAILTAGGFDESQQFGREDETLSQHIAASGHILFVPNAVVRHAPRDCFRSIWPWFFRRGRSAGANFRDWPYFLRINIWIRLVVIIVLCLLLKIPIIPALLLLGALSYLAILRRFTWARTYYPAHKTIRVLPIVRWVMDAAMSAGVLFEWLHCFKRNTQ